MKEVLERLQSLDSKFDKIIDLLTTQPRQSIDPVPANPLAPLHFLQSIVGKEEVKDFDELVSIFREHAIEPGDIRLDSEAWCGKGIRLALVSAGHDDPGEKYNRAYNWKDFGVEAEDITEPGIILVYYSHVSLRTEEGGEIGCNVGDSVKATPPGQNWFGTPVAYRKIAEQVLS